MPRSSFQITLGGRPVLLANRDNYRDPRPNKMDIPIGEAASHGWFLMRSTDAEALVTAGSAILTIIENTDGKRTSLPLRSMIVKGAEQFGYGGDKTVSLVELTDERWLWQRRSAMIGYYNLDPVASSKLYMYESTADGAGTPWTWDTMAADLWSKLSPSAGAWPGLPIGLSLTTEPVDWSLTGVNAWQALNTVLARIGCVVVFDPRKSVGFGRWSIQTLGSELAETNSKLDAAENRIAEQHPMPLADAIEKPAAIRVFFPVWAEHPGGERDTPHVQNWRVENVYDRTIALGAGGSGTLPVWSDTPAELDFFDALNNEAELIASANEIAAGIAADLAILSLRTRYIGLVAAPLDASTKSIRYAYSVSTATQTGGFFTTVMRHAGESTVGLRSTPRFRNWIDRLAPPNVNSYLQPTLPNRVQLVEVTAAAVPSWPDVASRINRAGEGLGDLWTASTIRIDPETGGRYFTSSGSASSGTDDCVVCVVDWFALAVFPTTASTEPGQLAYWLKLHRGDRFLGRLIGFFEPATGAEGVRRPMYAIHVAYPNDTFTVELTSDLGSGTVDDLGGPAEGTLYRAQPDGTLESTGITVNEIYNQYACTLAAGTVVEVKYTLDESGADGRVGTGHFGGVESGWFKVVGVCGAGTAIRACRLDETVNPGTAADPSGPSQATLLICKEGGSFGDPFEYIEELDDAGQPITIDVYNILDNIYKKDWNAHVYPDGHCMDVWHILESNHTAAVPQVAYASTGGLPANGNGHAIILWGTNAADLCDEISGQDVIVCNHLNHPVAPGIIAVHRRFDPQGIPVEDAGYEIWNFVSAAMFNITRFVCDVDCSDDDCSLTVKWRQELIDYDDMYTCPTADAQVESAIYLDATEGAAADVAILTDNEDFAGPV